MVGPLVEAGGVLSLILEAFDCFGISAAGTGGGIGGCFPILRYHRSMKAQSRSYVDLPLHEDSVSHHTFCRTQGDLHR